MADPQNGVLKLGSGLPVLGKEEIAELTTINNLHKDQRGPVAESDRERRRQRLQEIQAELNAMTEWKKP